MTFQTFSEKKINKKYGFLKMLTEDSYSFLEVHLLRVRKCPLRRGSRVQPLETVIPRRLRFQNS